MNVNTLSTPLFQFLCLCILLAMMTPPSMAQPVFDLQGHRGCRGLMPENTLPAFFRAVELGFNTLEMDVVISEDGEIVVSHEPWMSSVICSHPDGRPVKKSEEKKLNLYKMTYAGIQKYECGMRLHPGFPDQKKMQVVKPTLKMVVRSVERFAREEKYTRPRYNIEIKSDPKLYGTFQPDAKTFTELVVTEIRRLGVEEITTLQSFDLQVLEELNKVPERKFAISYLVEKGKDVKKNLGRLSFLPDIYSPLYKLVNEENVSVCHEFGVKVIPWTVNDAIELQKLKAFGIDGVISDFKF